MESHELHKYSMASECGRTKATFYIAFGLMKYVTLCNAILSCTYKPSHFVVFCTYLYPHMLGIHIPCWLVSLGVSISIMYDLMRYMSWYAFWINCMCQLLMGKFVYWYCLCVLSDSHVWVSRAHFVALKRNVNSWNVEKTHLTRPANTRYNDIQK